jgi:hypothetical protein
MKFRIAAVTAFCLAILAGWLILKPAPVASQTSSEGTKVGRYVYVNGGLFTTVMIDTQTGKTYALVSPDGMERGSEYAWVPITKFEDSQSYRRWVQQRREEMFGGQYWGYKKSTSGYYPNTTTTTTTK